MDKYKNAILEYEVARRDVRLAEKKRIDEVDRCEVVEAAFKNYESADVCLVQVAEGISYEAEDVEEPCSNSRRNYFERMLKEGGCKHCVKSYEIKRGELAKAKKRFGIAKRRLSAMGKKLIVSTTTKS